MILNLIKILYGVMKLDFRCVKCGCDKYQVKTTILPEKSPGLRLELGTYYIKRQISGKNNYFTRKKSRA